MSKLFDELRQNILDKCIRCGDCAKICPSIEIAQINNIKPNKIQKHLFDFVKNYQKNKIASKRIDSCIECFKCIDSCPKGINPLSFIEIAKSLSFKKGYEPYKSTSPDNYSSHYESIKNILTENEKTNVLKKSDYSDKKHVFFPGCNIYNNPAILLKVKEILNLINRDIAFLPGIQFCCGDNYFFNGRFEKAEEKYRVLTKNIKRYNPDTVILWCPTCLTRIKKMWNSPVKYVSFFQFCLENIHKLNFNDSKFQEIATLHEPCKTAYTGLDQSHRDIIRNIPNISLTEMKSGISCCGSGGITHFKNNTLKMITDKRLNEAVETGAEMLITVCHYCQEIFDCRNKYEELKIINLIDLMYKKIENE